MKETPTRREVLKATAAAGAATTGMSGAASASGGDSRYADPGPLRELFTCFTFWDDAPSDYPELDLTVEEPTTNETFPEDPEELVLYAHGWNSEGQNGLDQAATFERALDQNGYDYPVVNVEWPANGLNLRTTGDDGDAAGRKLADWIATYREEHPDVTIHLAGLSLGARVPLATVEALAEETVSSVVLFGPAVDADWVCSNEDDGYDVEAIESSAAGVYSYHSERDETICVSYVAGAFSTGIGCAGADCSGFFFTGSTPENYRDVDVTDQIDSHCKYQAPDEGIVPDVVDRFEADALAE